VIPVIFGIHGLRFGEIGQHIKFDCKNGHAFYLKAMLVLDRSFLKESYEDLLKCQNLSNSFRAMILYKQSNIDSALDLSRYLKKMQVGSDEIAEILKIYQVKKQKQKHIKLYEIFVDLLNNFYVSTTKENSFFVSKKYLMEIDKYPESNLKSMVKSLMALKNQNVAWAKEEVKKILFTDSKKNIFDFDISLPSKTIENDVLKYAEILSKTLDDKNIVGMYLNYISNIHDVLEIYNLKKKTRVNWSFTDISKQFMQGPQKKFLGLWSMIFAQFNEGSGEDIINKNLDLNYLENINIYELWIIGELNLTRLESYRKVILKKLQELEKIDDSYAKYLLIELLKIGKIREIFLKNEGKHRRVFVQTEHDLYSQFLNAGQVIDFSLYNLIKLGDFRERNLWWKIF